MVFRRGSDIFFGIDSSPIIFLPANRGVDFCFQVFTIEHKYFLYPAICRGGSRKMADGVQRTWSNRRNQAKLRGQKDKIRGPKPKQGKIPKPGGRMSKLEGSTSSSDLPLYFWSHECMMINQDLFVNILQRGKIFITNIFTKCIICVNKNVTTKK